MTDKDTKEYKKIFNNKKLSWAEKIEKAGEYANERVSYSLIIGEFVHELSYLVKQFRDLN